MSIFNLTEQDIEAIKASTEPPQLLARRYRVPQGLIEKLRPLCHLVYPGKLHDKGYPYKRYGDDHDHDAPSDQIVLDFRSLLHGGQPIKSDTDLI